jgi:hypothetical protein
MSVRERSRSPLSPVDRLASSINTVLSFDAFKTTYPELIESYKNNVHSNRACNANFSSFAREFSRILHQIAVSSSELLVMLNRFPDNIGEISMLRGLTDVQVRDFDTKWKSIIENLKRLSTITNNCVLFRRSVNALYEYCPQYEVDQEKFNDMDKHLLGELCSTYRGGVADQGHEFATRSFMDIQDDVDELVRRFTVDKPILIDGPLGYKNTLTNLKKLGSISLVYNPGAGFEFLHNGQRGVSFQQIDNWGGGSNINRKKHRKRNTRSKKHKRRSKKYKTTANRYARRTRYRK